MASGWKYELQFPIRHSTHVECPEWANLWLQVRRRAHGRFAGDLWLSKGYRHDGCTWAIDWHVTRRASPCHDAGYQFAEAIAAATGWTVREVLYWADRVFLEVMLADVRRPVHRHGVRYLVELCVQLWDTAVAYTYYAAVRLAGYRFHMLARSILGPAELRTKRRTAK